MVRGQRSGEQRLRYPQWPRELLVIAAIWFAIGLFNGGERYLRVPRGPESPNEAWWAAVAPNLRRAAIWAVLTPFVLALRRRHPLRSFREPRVAGLHAAALLLLPLVAVAGEIRLEGVAAGRSVTTAAALRYHGEFLTCITVFGVISCLESFRRARDSERRAATLRAELAAARLDALRAQLHPHFIFNTLNTIMPLISYDAATAARTVAQLRELFLMGIENTAPLASLGTEIEFLKRYLAIQETRFSERLSVGLHIEPAASLAAVPYLILQPLVENAIRHGIARLEGQGRIEIRGGRSGSRLVLEVLDDGPGIRRSNPDTPDGLGLMNTRSRLTHLYGDDHRFDLVDRPGGGVCARIEIPWTVAT